MFDITPDQMKKLVKDIATEFPISEFTSFFIWDRKIVH